MDEENQVPTGAKIEELVARVFEDRNAAHLAHWKTGSYAQHMALGDFYEGVVKITDKLVEVFQGKFGIISDLPTIPQLFKPTISQRLNATEEWIAQNAESVANGLESAENIIADLQGLYNTTLYKLNHLS